MTEDKDKKVEDPKGGPEEAPKEIDKKLEKPEGPKEKPKADTKETPKEEEKEASEGEEAPKERPAKEQAKEAPGEETKKARKSTVNVDDATPAQVVKVFKKVGLYGECYQVLARVLGGRDRGNLLRRNVRGPVKENDMIMLKETERDVRAV
jgi:small subunit ribosomal protein S28e